MGLLARFELPAFRDATKTFRLHCAAIGLAQAMYEAWRDAYARAAPDWIDLSKDTQDIWAAHAKGVLESLERRP